MLIHSSTRSLALAPRRGDFRRIFRERLRELGFAAELAAVEAAPAAPQATAATATASFHVDHADSLAWLAFRDCLRPAPQVMPTVVPETPPHSDAEEVVGVWTRAPKSRKEARAPRTIDCVWASVVDA